MTIVDCHAHIFPPLSGACGFEDAEEHLLYQQFSMHLHGNQPVRRLSDHEIVEEKHLWNGEDPSAEYPYRRAISHIRQLYDQFGADRLLWGSDMPNVERYCTYRQSRTYLSQHCDFIESEDLSRILGGNALALFSRGRQVASQCDLKVSDPTTEIPAVRPEAKLRQRTPSWGKST